AHHGGDDPAGSAEPARGGACAWGSGLANEPRGRASRSGRRGRDGRDACDCARRGRGSTAGGYRCWVQLDLQRYLAAHRVAHISNLLLCGFSLRTVACNGLGGYSCACRVDTDDQRGGEGPGEAALSVSESTKKRRVLFLCTGNSCRSQMAGGLLRDFAG